jgi:hypothetical protein
MVLKAETKDIRFYEEEFGNMAFTMTHSCSDKHKVPINDVVANHDRFLLKIGYKVNLTMP